MQRSGFKALAFQRAGQAGAAELAVDEHESLLHAAGFKNLVQCAALVVCVHAVEMLLYRRGGSVGTRDFNRHRVLQVARCQAFDFGREGR